MSYKKDITSRNNEELEKITRGDDDAQDLKALVVMEDEPTSPESHETTKDKVLKTIPKMAPWGDMHEELKIEVVMIATIVKQKEKNQKKKINDCGRLCAQVAN